MSKLESPNQLELKGLPLYHNFRLIVISQQVLQWVWAMVAITLLCHPTLTYCFCLGFLVGVCRGCSTPLSPLQSMFPGVRHLSCLESNIPASNGPNCHGYCTGRRDPQLMSLDPGIHLESYSCCFGIPKGSSS